MKSKPVECNLMVDFSVKFNRKRLVEWLENGDGHSVYAPDYFTKIGFPPEIVARFTRVQGGGPSYTSKIFDKSGNEIKPVAVYGLEMFRLLAGNFKLSSNCLGRGSEARDLGLQIMTKMGLPDGAEKVARK